MTALANVASPGAGGSGLTDAELRATPVPVSGTVSVTEPVSIDDNGASLTVDGTVAVSNFPATYPVTDNGGSLTVDGTFWQATQPVSGTVTASAQPGVDIGDVTINNAAGASAVNIQDGGNTITVDGTVGVSGSVAVTGTFWQATQPVSGTVTANLAAGTNNIGDVDVLSVTGTGTIGAAQVSVTNVSAQVVAARAGRRSLLIVNHGTTDVYLGAGTVTTANGILLTGTKGASISIPTAAAVNGIVGAGTQTVSYIEVY